jgi:hypothetical protein
MRKGFEGYYRPSKAAFDSLWKNAWIVPDTSVLLNCYRYGVQTRETLLDLFDRFEKRLWLPYQVAKEYHRGRVSVVAAQVSAYATVEQLLQKSLLSLQDSLNGYRRHPAIAVDEIVRPIEKATAKVVSRLAKLRAAHPDLLRTDPVRERLTDLFDGKVGDPFTSADLQNREKEADLRLSAEIPPGYKDAKKDQGSRRGDVFIWLQVLEQARKTKKPILFVTDDNKEDWWLRHEGQTLGPRPELRNEMMAVAGVEFYMYLTDSFMEQAQRTLKVTAKKEAITEVRELREKAESVDTKNRYMDVLAGTAAARDSVSAVAQAALDAGSRGPFGISPGLQAILDAGARQATGISPGLQAILDAGVLQPIGISPALQAILDAGVRQPIGISPALQAILDAGARQPAGISPALQAVLDAGVRQPIGVSPAVRAIIDSAGRAELADVEPGKDDAAAVGERGVSETASAERAEPDGE